MKRTVSFPLLAAAALLLAPAPASAARQDGAETRDLYLLLIRQARTDGRPRAALAYLADFERRHPGDLDARILRINCLLDLGQTAEAASVLAGLPQEDAVQTIRGHVLAAQGAWNGAAEAYRAALAAAPADPLLGNARGYAELRAGRAAQAAEILRAAADLAPGNAVVRNNLLLALTLSGRPDEAEAAIRKLPDAAERATLRRQLGAEADRLSAMVRGRH